MKISKLFKRIQTDSNQKTAPHPCVQYFCLPFFCLNSLIPGNSTPRRPIPDAVSRVNATKFDQIRPKKYFASDYANEMPNPCDARRLCTFSFWHLGFVWDLEFGIWDFAHRTLSGCCILAVHTGHSFHWTDQRICSNFPFVPNATRNAGQNTPAKGDTLPFEEALKKLETIVQAMESEELPLETLLGKYAEGTHLAKVCQDKLAEAELKIQQLEKNAAGEMKLKPVPINEQTE